MAAKFDNLNDVQSKFNSTIVMFDKKPFYVKNSNFHGDDQTKFILSGVHYGGHNKLVPLDDPLFSYKDYNLGYANTLCATWWYRKPLKQYYQGLRANQLGLKSTQQWQHFGIQFEFSKPFVDMLSNIYPKLDACAAYLKDGAAPNIAFHRDFALSWDAIHADYILEYRGQNIGNSANLKDFRLIDDAKHLHEYLQEAIA
jgi:hypothetical protein